MDLLGRARSFFKGAGAPSVSRVQYYSVVCPLGHRVRGQRTEGYQALRCPACGEGVFVLPISPLPEPIAPARSSARRPAREIERPVVDEGPLQLEDPDEVTVDFDEPRPPGGEVEIVWDDEPETAPAARSRIEPSPTAPVTEAASPGRASPEQPERNEAAPERARPRKPAAAPAARANAPSKSRPAPPRAPTVAADEPLVAAELRAAGSQRSIDRRPALIAASVVLLIAASFFIRSWRTRRGELPELARQGIEEGLPALRAGKYDRANQILGDAREAVDALGGAVDQAEEIRKAADEAAILANLSTDSLEAILDEAARVSPQSWGVRFDQVYRERAVVIDATITATPETSPNGRYEIDYVVVPIGEGSSGQDRYARFDLSDFQLLKGSGHRVGDHVLFGARLDSFAYDKSANCWMIRFKPESGVTITITEALEPLGWSSTFNLDRVEKGGDGP